MGSDRVLMIGLDAFEISFAETLMDLGELPHMKKLRDRSARYRLDHGRDKYSGLAWEHVNAGISPSDGGRWSAVHFDCQNYTVWQRSTSSRPFFADLDVPAVVFDVPYCDLGQAANARGIVNWGAHDPGVSRMSRPAEIAGEVAKIFGPYPAAESIYGFCWPSVEKTEKLSSELVCALAVRAKAARWLLSEKVPDWKLGMVVVSEAHSGTEPLWHGVDAGHPLHGLPSAKAAKQGLEEIYRGIDRLVGELTAACPDAEIILFSMHGMGRNEADVAAMLLLPELLYRHGFGKPYARDKVWPSYLEDGTPLLAEDSNWERAMEEIVPEVTESSQAGTFSRFMKRPGLGKHSSRGEASLDWMPAARYRRFWPEMQAFALPSFYDGRIRINLRDRESKGIVSRAEYSSVREKLCDLLREGRNSQSGEPVVQDIVCSTKDPMQLDASDADIAVIFRSSPLGMIHPQLGTIGPFPWRRTGGHTGDSGFLYFAGKGIEPGDHGRRSSFDVVPTVVDLLGGRGGAFSGESIVGAAGKRVVVSV